MLHAARYIPSFAFHAKLDAWNRVCMQLCIRLNIYEAHEGTAKKQQQTEASSGELSGRNEWVSECLHRVHWRNVLNIDQLECSPIKDAAKRSVYRDSTFNCALKWLERALVPFRRVATFCNRDTLSHRTFYGNDVLHYFSIVKFSNYLLSLYFLHAHESKSLQGADISSYIFIFYCCIYKHTREIVVIHIWLSRN